MKQKILIKCSIKKPKSLDESDESKKKELDNDESISESDIEKTDVPFDIDKTDDTPTKKKGWKK